MMIRSYVSLSMIISLILFRALTFRPFPKRRARNRFSDAQVHSTLYRSRKFEQEGKERNCYHLSKRSPSNAEINFHSSRICQWRLIQSVSTSTGTFLLTENSRAIDFKMNQTRGQIEIFKCAEILH